MPQNNIVFLNSTRQGAPAITGQVNTLNQALYQLLCTGCNSQTLDSITRTGSVATGTKSGHGFQEYDWVTIAGANETEYNGMVQVTGATSSTFTYAVSGTPASPSTGTITAIFSPLGWTRDYDSGNISVYHGDDQSSLLPLYVDDSGTAGTQSYRGAWVKGYESWSSGSGTNPWPTAAQLANGVWWPKSSTLDGTARAWWIRGNGKRFYMGTFWNASYLGGAEVFAFGDYLPTIAGNAFPGFIIGNYNDSQSYPGAYSRFWELVALGNVSSGKYVCRKYDGSGSALQFGMLGNNTVSAILGNGGISGVNLATSGYDFSQIDIHVGGYPYSALPGAYQLWNGQLLNNYDLLPPDSSIPGRRMMVFVIGYIGTSYGRLILDLTGPD